MGPMQSNAPGSVPPPWKAAERFFVGTEVQWKEADYLSTQQPSKLEKEFYAFGKLCGSEDGSHGLDEFAENLSAPRQGMVGAGKTQVYLAKLAGGITGNEATKEAHRGDSKMAEAHKLHNLLIAASPYGQYKEVLAFKTGYGIAQVILRINRHSGTQSP